MQIYIALLMTVAGIVGFCGHCDAESDADKTVSTVALKIASALLTALTAMVVSGHG